MTHDEAVDTHATEQYFLEELNGAERDAFEEHFFQCAVCAGDVEAGAALTAGIRSSPQHRNRFAERRPTRAFTFPLAAAASLLVALLAWQQLGVVAKLRSELHESRQARILPMYDLRSIRGEQEATIKDGRKPFTLNVEIPPDEKSTQYTCAIVDARGRTRLSVVVDAQQARRDFVPILVPGGVLEPGDYTLRVDSKPGVTYKFTVR